MGIKKRIISLLIAATMVTSVGIADTKAFATEIAEGTEATETAANKQANKAKTYTVTFMDGKKVVKKCKYKDEENIVYPKLSKDGYLFTGWYIKEDGDGIDNNYERFLGIKNITLHACWVDLDLITPVKAVTFATESMNVVLPEKDYKADKKQNIHIRSFIVGGNDYSGMIEWSTDNPDIIEIDDNGECYAKKYGDATVTLASKYNKSIKATCKVHVSPEYVFNKEPLSMTVDNKNINLAIGECEVSKIKVTGSDYEIRIEDADEPKSDEEYDEDYDPDEDGEFIDEYDNDSHIDIASVNVIGDNLVVEGNGNGKINLNVYLYNRKTKKYISSDKVSIVVGNGNYKENQYHDPNHIQFNDVDTYEEYDGCLAVPGNMITIKGICYQVLTADKGTGTVCAYYYKKDKFKTIDIPDTVKVNGYDYKVVEITNNTFAYSKKLKKLTIGKNVKLIGKNAFKNCKNLKTINIKSSKLTSKNVKKDAFKKINSKATVYVPKTKVKSYKKLLRSRGVGKNVKFKKLK